MYVGDLLASVIGNLQFMDELDGVGAFYAPHYLLGKTTKFIDYKEVP